MAIKGEPHIALVGGGYTLQHVAALLDPREFVITSRNATTCQAWRSRGWNAHQLVIEDLASVRGLFTAFPTIQKIVDSVPPLRLPEDPTVGPRTIVSALEGRNISRIIYLSTTGVFGCRDGSVVTEDTPPAPWNPQGEARWLSEQVYGNSGLPFTALRLPAIYGFDRGVVFSIRQGTYRLVGSGEFWTNRIHVVDLARVIEAALRKDSLPPVLCVVDDEPAQAKVVAEFVCTHERLPLPGCVAAADVLKAGGYTMLSNQRVHNGLMKTVLGLTLKYPSYREGLYESK